jgi:hypothetical protein
MKHQFILFISLFLLFACTTKDVQIASALNEAGDNRVELEKVLSYYSKDKPDSIKQIAAEYLIKNIQHHYAFDTTNLYKYRPVVEVLDSLRRIGASYAIRRDYANPLLEELLRKNPIQKLYAQREDDVKHISSELLVQNINQAVESYNINPFKDSILFTDFLEYVLPYRIQNGSCLENWRTYFIQNYSKNVEHNFLSIQQYCDSLLYEYKDVKLGWKIAEQYPYFKLDDYLLSLTTSCSQRCWFNSLYLRSFGIPATIDFTPASRVHEPGHEWNALKLKNGTYPFEPFWEEDIWQLKGIYSRLKEHSNLGSIQFPKIYRRTYQMHVTELLKHAMNTTEEIPPLFHNPFQKDVTKEYFKVFGFKSNLTDQKHDQNYAYACVMGANRRWIPVEFAKIKRGTVTFKDLGSNNIYLPSTYYSSTVIPSAYPVLLCKNGKAIVLSPDSKNTRTIKISDVSYRRPTLKRDRKCLVGAKVEGSDDKDFSKKEVLFKIDEAYKLKPNNIKLPSTTSYRFYRFTVPDLKDGKLDELKFFKLASGKQVEVRGKLISSYPKDSSMLKQCVDDDILTRVSFHNLSPAHKAMEEVWIGYDFKFPTEINSFEYHIRDVSGLRKDVTYELFYWDYEWKSLGREKASSNLIDFENVPDNALLLIKIIDTNKFSRIFTFSEGIQHWW